MWFWEGFSRSVCFLVQPAQGCRRERDRVGKLKRKTEKAAWLQAEMENLGREALSLPATQHPQNHKAHGAGFPTALILRPGILV